MRTAALRITQAELAERLGFTESVVRKWEKRGETITLTHQHAAAMDTLLARLDDDQRHRFESARCVSEAPAGADADPFDRSDAIVGRLQHLAELRGDGDLVDGLSLALGEIVDRYEVEGPRHLASEVQELRRRVNLLLQQRRHPAHVEQLYRIAARLSGVLAYMAVNCGRFGSARMHCREAQVLASLIEDGEMLAWVKSTESFCAYYAGDFVSSVKLAEEGIELAGSGSQAIRLYSNGLARAWGKLGDAVEVEQAIERALSLADHQNAVPGLTPALTFESYGKARLMANAATAFLSAGRFDKALEFGGLVEDHVSQSDSVWSRTLVRLDVATALVLQRSPEVEHAVQLGIEALDASADRPIRSIWQRANELGALMESRHRAPSRDYAERLAQWRRSAQPLIAPESGL
ncbi:multiprotein-bridging factor 1 family protein [Nocardia sp. NPDC058480]|uniref:helix-turn-helix domain-containing protein n=1 Tax=Nocardia sp. NPDC058480 TaxID=3346522 RepID=UPI0036472004